MTLSYDLLHRCWIRVVRTDGPSEGHDVVGLVEAMTAPDILAVVHRDPLVEVALHRLMLTVLQAACPQVVADGEEVPADYPVKAVREYLEAHAERFDLFHDTTPFLQRSGLVSELEPRSPTLIGELWAGDSRVFESHTAPGTDDAVPAQVAVEQLLVAHVFHRGGLSAQTTYVEPTRKGRTATGGPLVPGAGALSVLITGRDLQHTLLLNMHRPTELGTPVWATEERTAPTGYLGRLLFPVRAVLFTTTDEGESVSAVRIGVGYDIRPLFQSTTDPSQIMVIAKSGANNGETVPMKTVNSAYVRRSVHLVLAPESKTSGCQALVNADAWVDIHGGDHRTGFTIYGHNGSFQDMITEVVRIHYPMVHGVIARAGVISGAMERARIAVNEVSGRIEPQGSRETDRSGRLREILWSKITGDWNDYIRACLTRPAEIAKDGSDEHYARFHDQLRHTARTHFTGVRGVHPVDAAEDFNKLLWALKRCAPGAQTIPRGKAATTLMKEPST